MPPMMWLEMVINYSAVLALCGRGLVRDHLGNLRLMKSMLSGTTCATVLARAIYSEGCKSVAAGMNAMDLRRGINLAVDSVVSYLKSRAKMISTTEEIAQVCLSMNVRHCQLCRLISGSLLLSAQCFVVR